MNLLLYNYAAVGITDSAGCTELHQVSRVVMATSLPVSDSVANNMTSVCIKMMKYKIHTYIHNELLFTLPLSTFACKMLNVYYSVQNDESLHGHCTNERRVRKRDKKVRKDVI